LDVIAAQLFGVRLAARAKNKAGRVPCFEISVFHRLPPDIVFLFWSGCD
jgi:hypothetical protein